MELTAADIAMLLPKRDENAHKGNFGRILLLCGSLGYTGAAYFAAMGALRTGAGLWSIWGCRRASMPLRLESSTSP